MILMGVASGNGISQSLGSVMIGVQTEVQIKDPWPIYADVRYTFQHAMIHGVYHLRQETCWLTPWRNF